MKATITDDNQQSILYFIENYITKDKADNVIVENMGVSYKGSTSNWNTNVFHPVDGGTFNLTCENDIWYLNYSVNMRQLFIISSIMSVAVGIIAQVEEGDWWVGIIAFLWFCGANWVIICIRHGMEVGEIVEGIDELICGKPVREEIEKIPGKLKSWM